MLHRETVSPSTLGLLRALCAHPVLDAFALAGGTALALRYGHRISVDLDFFAPESFDSHDLAASLGDAFQFVPTAIHENSLSGTMSGVKVDFVTYRHALLQPFEMVDGVRLFGLHDNIAMKLSALTNRGVKKDFFDAHRVIQELGIDEIVGIYRAKFPAHDCAILLRSLVYFDDAEDEFDPNSLDGTDWEQVKEAVTQAVRGLL